MNYKGYSTYYEISFNIFNLFKKWIKNIRKYKIKKTSYNKNT